MILAIVEDLFFGSKISAGANANNIPLTLSSSFKAAPEGDYEMVILDLQCRNQDPMETLRAVRSKLPSTKIIGYLNHTAVPLKKAALASGCDRVYSRSEFTSHLDQLLKEL